MKNPTGTSPGQIGCAGIWNALCPGGRARTESRILLVLHSHQAAETDHMDSPREWPMSYIRDVNRLGYKFMLVFVVAESSG